MRYEKKLEEGNNKIKRLLAIQDAEFERLKLARESVKKEDYDLFKNLKNTFKDKKFVLLLFFIPLSNFKNN